MELASSSLPSSSSHWAYRSSLYGCSSCLNIATSLFFRLPRTIFKACHSAPSIFRSIYLMSVSDFKSSLSNHLLYGASTNMLLRNSCTDILRVLEQSPYVSGALLGVFWGLWGTLWGFRILCCPFFLPTLSCLIARWASDCIRSYCSRESLTPCCVYWRIGGRSRWIQGEG